MKKKKGGTRKGEYRVTKKVLLEEGISGRILRLFEGRAGRIQKIFLGGGERKGRARKKEQNGLMVKEGGDGTVV